MLPLAQVWIIEYRVSWSIKILFEWQRDKRGVGLSLGGGGMRNVFVLESGEAFVLESFCVFVETSWRCFVVSGVRSVLTQVNWERRFLIIKIIKSLTLSTSIRVSSLGPTWIISLSCSSLSLLNSLERLSLTVDLISDPPFSKENGLLGLSLSKPQRVIFKSKMPEIILKCHFWLTGVLRVTQRQTTRGKAP